LGFAVRVVEKTKANFVNVIRLSVVLVGEAIPSFVVHANNYVVVLHVSV